MTDIYTMSPSYYDMACTPASVDPIIDIRFVPSSSHVSTRTGTLNFTPFFQHLRADEAGRSSLQEDDEGLVRGYV
jgi:hypothetical protein